MTTAATVEIKPLGTLEYGAALAAQRALHEAVVAGSHPGAILVVEHPPVLTLGRHADERHLKATEAFFAKRGVGVFRIERGGEVTAHEPGQVVVYPIVRLPDFGLMPKSYVELLEDAVIGCLATYGIDAATDPEHPGVWVGDAKVCAVGVRVKDRATLHGIALNVANSLELFELIVPCGIGGRRVTSMSRLLDRPVSPAEVAAKLAGAIQARLVRR